MNYNLESFTDEERERVEALINQIKEEKKERTEKWLKDYLEEEKLFKSAKYEINNVACNLNHILEKIQRREYITEYDWDNWFIALDRVYGALFRVTKR